MFRHVSYLIAIALVLAGAMVAFLGCEGNSVLDLPTPLDRLNYPDAAVIYQSGGREFLFVVNTNRLYTAKSGTLTVIDTATDLILADSTLLIGSDASDLLIYNDKLFLADRSQNAVVVYSISVGTVAGETVSFEKVAEIDVAKGPMRLVSFETTNSEKRIAVVCNQAGVIAVINPETYEVVDTDGNPINGINDIGFYDRGLRDQVGFSVATGYGIADAVYDKDQRRLYVMCSIENTFFAVDTDTYKVVGYVHIDFTQNDPTLKDQDKEDRKIRKVGLRGAVVPATDTLWIGSRKTSSILSFQSFSKLTPSAGDSQFYQPTPPATAAALPASPDAKPIFAGDLILTGDKKTAIAVFYRNYDVAKPSEAGASGDGVRFITVDGMAVAETIILGDGRPVRLVLSSDESKLYVINFVGNSVSVINMTSKTLVKTIS